MQAFRDKFIASTTLLLDLLTKSKKVQVANNAEKLMQAIFQKQLDTVKEGFIIKKIYNVIGDNIELLITRNIDLFALKEKKDGKNVTITIIPAIDIGSAIQTLDKESQRQLWDYLAVAFIACSSMMKSINGTIHIDNDQLRKIYNPVKKLDVVKIFWEKYPDSDIILKFNPFAEIGENNDDYTIDDIMNSSTALLPDETGSMSGVAGLATMFGIDKMLNMDDLIAQLKNLTPEQSESAKQAIKELMGCESDPETSEFVDTMMDELTHELKYSIDEDKPLESLQNLAQNIASKVMPKINPSKLNPDKIFDQTMKMANNMKDKNGNPILNSPNNPLSYMTNLLQTQLNNAKKGINENGKQMTDKDYERECQKMMKNMGLTGISPNDLRKVPLGQLIADIDKKTKNKK